MGTTSSNTASVRRRSPRSSNFSRRTSPQTFTFARRSRSPQIRTPAVEEAEQVFAPEKRKKGSKKRRSALPRDPTTGRYLPRRTCSSAASPQAKRRVEVEVINTPQSEVQAETRLRTATSRGRGRRASTINAEATSPPQRRVAARKSPPRQAAIAQPLAPRKASPRRKPPVVVAAPMEPTARGSPILRSSYTRARSASPTVARQPAGVRAEAPAQPEAPVSRREYASPSLASNGHAQPEDAATIGPSTNRRVRKMAATTPVSVADFETPEQPPTSVLSRPLEKLAHSSPKVENPTDLLFSYLNAA